MYLAEGYYLITERTEKMQVKTPLRFHHTTFRTITEQTRAQTGTDLKAIISAGYVSSTSPSCKF